MAGKGGTFLCVLKCLETFAWPECLSPTMECRIDKVYMVQAICVCLFCYKYSVTCFVCFINDDNMYALKYETNAFFSNLRRRGSNDSDGYLFSVATWNILLIFISWWFIPSCTPVATDVLIKLKWCYVIYHNFQKDCNIKISFIYFKMQAMIHLSQTPCDKSGFVCSCEWKSLK